MVEDPRRAEAPARGGRRAMVQTGGGPRSGVRVVRGDGSGRASGRLRLGGRNRRLPPAGAGCRRASGAGRGRSMLVALLRRLGTRPGGRRRHIGLPQSRRRCDRARPERRRRRISLPQARGRRGSLRLGGSGWRRGAGCSVMWRVGDSRRAVFRRRCGRAFACALRRLGRVDGGRARTGGVRLVDGAVVAGAVDADLDDDVLCALLDRRRDRGRGLLGRGGELRRLIAPSPAG